VIVIFRRTGQRRYAVVAKRESFPDIEMNPAPGYDALVPHDLMHLVVEAQLGLTRGVFGQLAAGGDAGTFHPIFDSKVKTRTVARTSKRVKKRNKKLLRDGRDECQQSERATFVCWQEWLSRSKATPQRAAAKGMTRQAVEVRVSRSELRKLSEKKMAEICSHLDELSAHWSKLQVGQSFSVRWPDLAAASDVALLT
jgi:hypothetical protein